jgi:uncharacterized protein (DUF302 family)
MIDRARLLRMSVKPTPLITAFLIVLALAKGSVMAADGLITLSSKLGPKETIERLEAEIRSKGMTVFTRIDHAAGAAAVSLPLRPTDVIIFGSAKAGTPLMQVSPTIGLDLPLKMLVWQDAEGRTWLGYNDPKWLAARHGLGTPSEATVAAMATLLDSLARKAAALP